KNKCLIEGGEKGVKKKVVDPFSKSDWNEVKALNIFSIRHTGKILVTRTLKAKLHLMASRVMCLKYTLLIFRMMKLHLENSTEEVLAYSRLLAE
ncbi:hypothetical protein LEMLEM_LOCUS17583, partial [Lemmus lemmus]